MTRKIFKELAEVRQRTCISVYLPTERVGDNKKARIRFKNIIQGARNELQELGMQGKDILEFTKPFDMLLEDSEIWRHMSDGLAVFLSPGKFAYSAFPIRFTDQLQVGNHFYLLPLMPVFNGDGRFFVLTLSLKKAQLFEGSRDHMSEIEIEDLVPQSINDTVGYDYEQKSLQFRTGQSAEGKGLYHGQGRGKDYKKDEIEKHLREVNRNLVDILQGYDAPLVLACVDYIYPIFKKVNTYEHLFGKHIPGNADEAQMQWLHGKAWELLSAHFQKHRRETLKHYQFLASKGRTSSILEDVVLAAEEGQIETLFVAKGEQRFGVIDPADNGGIRLHDEKNYHNYCLLDFAARSAFLKGSKVYLMDGEEMPDKGSVISATLRF